MNRHVRVCVGVLLLSATWVSAPASAALVSATDTNPDPNIFEAWLTADEQDVTIASSNVHTESASIHWHGIELDNDSDGTAVTQDAVLPGQTYTYRFKAFRHCGRRTNPAA